MYGKEPIGASQDDVLNMVTAYNYDIDKKNDKTSVDCR